MAARKKKPAPIKFSLPPLSKEFTDTAYAHAKEWFYIRNFGVTTKGFKRGDFLAVRKRTQKSETT